MPRPSVRTSRSEADEKFPSEQPMVSQQAEKEKGFLRMLRPKFSSVRPLRIFCFPCVVVNINDLPSSTTTPTYHCPCHSSQTPTSPSNQSPMHLSANAAAAPATFSASYSAAQPQVSTSNSLSQQNDRIAEQTNTVHGRITTNDPASSNTVTRSELSPAPLLNEITAHMTVVLNSTHLMQPPVSTSNVPVDAENEPVDFGSPAINGDVYVDHGLSASHPYASSNSHNSFDSQSDVTEETSHGSLSKHLQDSSPESISRAVHILKNPDISADCRKKLMYPLDKALRAACSNENESIPRPHSNVRMEAHKLLASFYASLEPPRLDKVLDHCQAGLDLASGRERLFPHIVAALHSLKARSLVDKGELSLIPEGISHAKAARVALYACSDPKLQYEICLTLGDAYSVRIDETPCENIRNAYESYSSAIEISRISALDPPLNVIWLSCRVALLIIRFLRHKRSSTNDPNSSCRRSGTAICQKDQAKTGDMYLRRMTVSHLITMMEQLRIDHERAREDEREDSERYRQLNSNVYECIGRGYLERARSSSTNVIQDLKKSRFELLKALNSCSWSDDPGGQRSAVIRETIDEIQGQLRIAKKLSNQVTSSHDSDDEPRLS